jgi:hypothetical protein
VKTAASWQSERLVEADAELILPSFGLRCSVGDLYEGTPLLRRPI